MPIFGDTTDGGSSFPCSGDRAVVGKFTLTEAGDVESITVIFDETSTAGMNFKGIIYDDNGTAGAPGTRLAVGQATAVPAGGGAITSTLSTPVSLAAGDYWLGGVTDSFEGRFATDTGVGGERQEGLTYASPADPFGTPAGSTGERICASATYSVAASAVGPLLPGKLVNRGRLRGFLKR